MLVITKALTVDGCHSCIPWEQDASSVGNCFLCCMYWPDKDPRLGVILKARALDFFRHRPACRDGEVRNKFQHKSAEPQNARLKLGSKLVCKPQLSAPN